MTGEWVETRLGDLMHIDHGWAFKSSLFSEELTGRPIVVAIGNFRYTGGFRFESTKTKEYRGEYPNGYELSPSDILLAMTCQTSGGEILGIPARVPDDGRTYLHNQRLGRVVVDQPDRLDTDFVYWLCLWARFNHHLFTTASGTKILHTSPGRIEDFVFPAPPLDEQRRIAAILGALDDKIELNRKMNRTLEEMAQAIFKSWFIDFDGHDDLVESEIGMVPRGWEVVSMDDEATVHKGLSYKSAHFEDGGRPLVNLKCIDRNGGFRRDGLKYYAGEYKDRHVVRHGDIVIAMTDLTQKREVIASPALVPSVPGWDQLLMSLDLCSPRLRHGSWLSPEWLYRRLKTDSFREFARGYANGTTVLHLKMDGVTRYRFARPPETDVRRFTDSVAPMHARMAINREESDTLGALRDTLLPKLISGEIRVTEGEALLEAVS